MFSKLSAFALLAVTAFVSAAPTDDTCARFYTVQPGDTCDKIGQTQSAPTWQIKWENSDYINEDCSNLFPGESICLGVTGRDCQQVYVIKAGDTCLSAADQAGLPLDVFMKANGLAFPGGDCFIYPGEVLCTDSRF